MPYNFNPFTGTLDYYEPSTGLAAHLALTNLDAHGATSTNPVRVTGSASTVLTGSIQPTASVNVVGVNTLFTTELMVGDRITVNTQTRAVRSIADDTHLVVDEAFVAGGNDTSPDKEPSSFIVRDVNGVPNFMVFNNGAPYFLSKDAPGEFDTATTFVSGALFKFKNNEVAKVTINYDGTISSIGVFPNPTSLGTVANMNFTTSITGTPAGATSFFYGVLGSLTASALGGNITGEISGGKYSVLFNPGGNYNAGTLTGIQATISSTGSFGSTSVVTLARCLLVSGTFINAGTVSTCQGLIVTLSGTLTTITLYEGIHIDAAPTASTKRGIYLKGNGVGNDLVMGASAQSDIYYDGSHLVLNPKLSGTGTVKLLGHLTTNANDIILDTTTGTKIGTATNQKLGFFNTTPIVQPTDGNTLTNNVTSGGTTDTIADYADLTVYANDAATIRDNLYQLSRKVKILCDNMRSLGLAS